MIGNVATRTDVRGHQSPASGQGLRSLLIADDDPRFRQALRAFIELYRHSNQGWFQQINEADCGQTCLTTAMAQQPDLILLDLEFLVENESGLDILDQLRQTGFSGKVAIVSGHNHPKEIFRAMKAGACGYLLKDRLIAQLPDALQAWASDRVYLGDEVTNRFFSVFNHPDRPTLHLEEDLTNREREVLQLLVNGASNQEMADRLYITSGTVKAHLTSIFNKLHVSSRTQAIVRAVKTGLVEIEEVEFEER